MKALFVRCYGKLTADMMIGGLIDMGVPPVYLRSKLEDAGLSAPFIEKANPKAQISAHYFHIPETGEKPMLLKERDIFKLWRDICEKGAPDWEDTGWKVFSALTSGASDAIDEIAGNIIDLRRIGVSEENLISALGSSVSSAASCRRFGSSIRDLMKMSVEAMAKKLLASSRSNACALLR